MSTSPPTTMATTAATAALRSTPIYFGPFLVTSQVFHKSPLSYALVNLKPLLPGHILVSPLRRVPRLSDLTPPETTDLFLTVQLVSRMIERVYKATSLNIAIQDGVDAGQTVPHVHAHVIPRRGGDLDDQGGGDRIYDMLDGEEGDLGGFYAQVERRRKAGEGGRLTGVDFEERRPRGMEEMEGEARMLEGEMRVELGRDRE